MSGKREKNNKKKIVIILAIIFIISTGLLIKLQINKRVPKIDEIDVTSKLENIDENANTVTEEPKENLVTERMLQVQELKKENEDIVGWLEIEGTEVSFPVLQGDDNEYYMKHTYDKQYSSDGSIFLDKDYDWNLPSSNLLIYGHNNLDGNMFQHLIDYKNEEYYKQHSSIKFTTVESDDIYDILAVFKSRVYYQNEKNVFRYYYFINVENEDEYNYYVEEAKKASLYETGITAKYGEQLLTLSTCDYEEKDGRFAIVAKKRAN